MWDSVDDGGFGGKSRFDQPGGGGFLNTTVSSPSTSEKKKAPERITNVVPITIAQIHMLSDSDENLKVGSLSAKIITFIGMVKKSDVQSTKVTHVMTDHTGPSIEVQIWIGEAEEQSRKMCDVPKDHYARVTGSIRAMKGKRYVIAFNIRPIDDINEITLHMAEVVHASMAVAVMDKQSTAPSTGFNSTSMLTNAMDTSSDTFGSNLSKLTKPQQMVKQVIINCKDEKGMNVREIQNSLKSLSRESIKDAIDFLSNEGHIYSTIDEDHYKSTDCV